MYMKKHTLIWIALLLIFVIICVNGWNCQPDYKRSERTCDIKQGLTKDGIFYKENFLTTDKHLELKQKYHKQYDSNTVEIDARETFLSDDAFLDFLRNTTNQPSLKLVSKSDNR